MRHVGEPSVFRAFWLMVALGSIVMTVPGVAQGEDAGQTSEPVTVRKSKEGLNFTLPPDWPIEKRGGITAPIPVEEYLSRKFSVLESRLKLLEQQANGLDVRLRVLEEDKKQRRQGLQSSGSASTP